MKKVVIQAHYKENVLGLADQFGSKTVVFNSKHQKEMAADMIEMIKDRERNYQEKLKAKDKGVKTVQGRVVHNDTKYLFLSMLIQLGHKVY